MSRAESRLPLWSVAAGVVLSTSALARAQDAPPPPPPADPAVTAPLPAPPPPPAALPPANEAPPVTPVVAPPAAEKGEVAPPSAPSAIKVNFGVRAAARLQNPSSPDKIDRVQLDTLYVEPRFSGELTPNFSWQANFNASVTSGTLAPAGSVGVMDLIAQFRATDEFNVWAGRLLVPSDRSNFSGPFFMSPCNYPGFYVAGAPLGPKDGPNGRDQGAVAWGQFMGGKFKYYAGAFGFDPTNSSRTTPYFSGRLNLALLGAEPGFYHSSTYYGSQDIVALGAAIQYQKDGASNPDGSAKDMVNVMADVLAEGKLGDAGVFTFEGQYYHFNSGYAFASVSNPAGGSTGVLAPQNAFYALVSWLSPEVGIGKFQPLVRVQHTFDPDWTIVDAFLTYVIKGYDLRIAGGYQRTDTGAGSGANAIQLGIQLQK